MTTRKLGNSGLEIPALVFGGNVFGWTADESTSFRLLDALLDAGLNCIDTADVYSRWVPGHQGGESETLIGKWLKRTGKRDRMVIDRIGLAADALDPDGACALLAGGADGVVQGGVLAEVEGAEGDRSARAGPGCRGTA